LKRFFGRRFFLSFLLSSFVFPFSTSRLSLFYIYFFSRLRHTSLICAAKTNFPLRDYESEVAEYEAWMVGAGPSMRSAEVAATYTLPAGRVAGVELQEGGKKPGVVYAEQLRAALRGVATGSW
jgi:hypothetical protein